MDDKEIREKANNLITSLGFVYIMPDGILEKVYNFLLDLRDEMDGRNNRGKVQIFPKHGEGIYRPEIKRRSTTSGSPIIEGPGTKGFSS